MSANSPVGLADAGRTATGAPPPHRLWATLESAYTAPEPVHSATSEERWSLHLALPFAVGLSLALWVLIVELVLTR